MAIRFNIKKYEQIKAEYLKYLETGSANASVQREFEAYKLYLDADDEVKAARSKFANKPKVKASPEKPAKENHEIERFIHPKIAQIYAYWEERISEICAEVRQNGISKKRLGSITDELNQASLTNEQRKYFRGLINKAANSYQQELNARLRQKKIEDKDFFTISIRIKGKGHVDINFKNLVENIENKTIDLLNVQQIHFLTEKIDYCDREYGDVPELQEVIKRYRAYLRNERKRDRQRIRSQVSTKPLESKWTLKQEQKHEKDDIPEMDITPKFVPEEIIVAWKDIRFFNNLIRIGTPIFNKPILVKKFCSPSYNQIKELLAEKLPKIIILTTQEGGYKLKEDIPLRNAIALIKKREAEELFNDKVRKTSRLGFKKALQIAEDQELLLQKLKERKQKYINYLISLHAPLGYKVVPAVEFLAHESSESVAEEDAFIFTIPSRRTGCVQIVYENVNIARASLIFVVQKDKYLDCLQSIFNFMGDDNFKNKREFLRARPYINATGVLAVHHVNHTDDMHDWAIKLK